MNQRDLVKQAMDSSGYGLLEIKKKNTIEEKDIPNNTSKFMKIDREKSKQKQHRSDKPYKCDEYNKQFSMKANLKRHQRTHSGEKPYKCDQCSKQFSRKDSLIRHKRTHIGEKPYTCNQCSKQFSMKCNLIVHHRTHSGEK